jgi:hypothetical protein
MLNLKERIDLLAMLGEYLKDTEDIAIQKAVLKAGSENPWFTKENVNNALKSLETAFLQDKILRNLSDKYCLDDHLDVHKIGLILAGNIPLVGWHDIMSCFICNKISIIKYSDKDKVLIPFLIEKLISFNPQASDYFESVDRLTDYDAVIATGGNNSATVFEHYFKHVPNIIRRNRNAVAILDGKETTTELEMLSEDIFSYYGLGCRNVSKLYISDQYDFTPLFIAFEKYTEIIHHNKYKNNYDYNFALFLLNQEPILQHDIIILRAADQIASRIGSLNYEYYKDVPSLKSDLSARTDEIQCIIAGKNFQFENQFNFGLSQHPSITDYADGVDTIQFLLSL